MESAPLSRGEVYYEPTGGEPVSVTHTHPAFSSATCMSPSRPAGGSDLCLDSLTPAAAAYFIPPLSVRAAQNAVSELTLFLPLPPFPEPGRRDQRSPERRRRPGPGQRPGVVRSRAAGGQHRPRRELRVPAHVRVGETQAGRTPARTAECLHGRATGVHTCFHTWELIC